MLATLERPQASQEPARPAVDRNSKVFVIMPAYNEQAVIGDVVRAVRAIYPNVVVVDDGSKDQTGAEARKAGAQVLRHLINRGAGAAMQTGMEYSLLRGAEYFVNFDSDGQHCVEDIARLIDQLTHGGYEIALGSRFLGQTVDMPLSRGLMLKAATAFTRVVSGLRVTDTHNGLRAFTRKAASHIKITLDRFAHCSELLDQIQRSGLPYTEVPVTIRYTDYSRAKGQRNGAAFRILFDYLWGRIVK